MKRAKIFLIQGLFISLIWLFLAPNGFSESKTGNPKPKIAVFSGPTATIQNSEPLITSNKAREKYGLPLLKNPDGTPIKYDHLVPQRLAAPVEVFIEQFSAHPLEKDAAELYAPPDGYIDKNGNFHEKRQSPGDKPVYRITLHPQDGPYLLPYMARQVDGKPWDGDCAYPLAPASKCRQPFFPDASRIFEEIDRGIYGVNEEGTASVLSSKVDYDFYRAVPSGGYKKGLSKELRTDVGNGDIPPEGWGQDFFVYKPFHLSTDTRVHDLAKASNTIQKALDTGKYVGAIWLEGSPSIEETIYWLNLLVDTTVPIIGNAAQRANRAVSADGPGNIVDSVDYIVSKVWAGPDGKNELGAIMIQDEQIFAARQVQKSDARPGGYIPAGDHGGILGTMGKPGSAFIYFKPALKHTWKSEINLRRLTSVVKGVKKLNGRLTYADIKIKDSEGYLLGNTIPKVTIVKGGRWYQDSSDANPDDEVDILARIEKNLKERPLAGFVAEGLAPYGTLTAAQMNALEIAAFSGMPVVIVGRGNAGGLTATNPFNLTIEGNNLTGTKSRLLLKACLMKFGSLPVAKDPRNPTLNEKKAIQAAIAKYQEVFNSH